MVFRKEHDMYLSLPAAPNSTYLDRLPKGVYVVKHADPIGFYLERMESFKVPRRIYGTSTPRLVHRILSTFASREGNTTGVVLAGEKGSGKTLVTKLISHEIDAPTLIVNAPYCSDDFFTFLNNIKQSCVVLFDEFEKVYNKEAQAHMLTFFDGAYKTHKLFLLTLNDRYSLRNELNNRPGRMYYAVEFGGVDEAFIRDYCKVNLKQNDLYIEAICRITGLFEAVNFDMLQALVEELNRYGETVLDALQFLNVKPFSSQYEQTFDFTIVENATGKIITGLCPNHNYGNGFHEREGQFRGMPLFSQPKKIYYYPKSKLDEDGDVVPAGKGKQRQIHTIIFNSNHLRGEGDRDTYVYNNGSFTLTLKKHVPPVMDYSHFNSPAAASNAMAY